MQSGDGLAESVDSYFNLPVPPLSSPVVLLNGSPSDNDVPANRNQKHERFPSRGPGGRPSVTGPITTPLIAGFSDSAYGVDPPRPPREGFEWVWFPEGYWAERGFIDLQHKRISTNKFWKWRSRSTKSTSEAELPETLRTSSALSLSTPFSMSKTDPKTSPNAAASLYLSESAHVLSLQHPLDSKRPSESSDSMLISPASEGFRLIISSRSRSGTVVRSPSHAFMKHPPDPPVRGFYRRAKREVETRLRLKGSKVRWASLVEGNIKG